MEIIKLKSFEILNLNDEIQGIQDQNRNIISKGLLKQEFPFIVKYWLHYLSTKITREKNIIDKIQNELIQKYGDINEKGNIEISVSIQDGINECHDPVYKVNPKFVEFQKEYNNVLKEEKEIKYTPFRLEDLKKMTTNENYPTFYKLIIE